MTQAPVLVQGRPLEPSDSPARTVERRFPMLDAIAPRLSQVFVAASEA